ncbi:MAG: hypothetical protein ACOX7B_09920 [Christensenellales bacterium]|jgi:hypothetical protein
MKYSVGYQLRKSDDWINAILANKKHVEEVYYSWPGFPNGRGDTGRAVGFTPWEAQARIEKDLRKIAESGINTNLLLNAMCYGAQSQARTLFMRIGETLDYSIHNFKTNSVTTTSPLIARFVHENFEGIEVRASINMEIGSTRSMETVVQYFDGFYMRRELNREPAIIEELKKWCDQKGRKLHFLANSGCIADCAMHVFHDNLVAHEQEISILDNAYDFRGVCWERLGNPALRENYLASATFVRPEDIIVFEQWFSVAKLATRTNRDPVRVLNAYIRNSYSGSLPALMEPNHEHTFIPLLLENTLLPTDFGRHVMECRKNCNECSYCKQALSDALVRL